MFSSFDLSSCRITFTLRWYFVYCVNEPVRNLLLMLKKKRWLYWNKKNWTVYGNQERGLPYSTYYSLLFMRRNTAGRADNPTCRQTTLCDILLLLYDFLMISNRDTWLNSAWKSEGLFNFKSNYAAGHPIDEFLLWFNSKLCLNLSPLTRYAALKCQILNLTSLTLFKFKFNDTSKDPIYDFLLVVNSNTRPNTAPRHDIYTSL